VSKEYKTPEAKRARNRANYEANKEKIKARVKAYREANKEKLRSQRKAYREANKEKIKAQSTRDARNARVRSKYTSNIPFKLYILVRTASQRVLGRMATKQEAMDLLGCTFEEYQDYLESKFQPGMTWENHTVEGWHIDHILPLKESEIPEEEKLKRLHYTNTQPLWAEDNHSKGNKIPSV
jgi:hypothetical protein